MDQQNNSSDSQVNFQSPSNDTPRRSFRMKKGSVIGVLALLIVAAAVPLTVKIAQQTQNLKQRAATEGVTCHRCSNTNLGKWATFQTNDACPGGVSDTAQPIAGTITYEDKAECRNVTTATCTFDSWKNVPDWMKGNNSLGNGYYCGPENPENAQICGGTESGKWVPGPIITAGSILGYGGQSPNFAVTFGGKTPVDYNSANDILRGEFSGHQNAESSWSKVVRRMDDSYFGVYANEVASRQIATGVLLKYEIIRAARDAVHFLAGWNGDAATADQQINDIYDANKTLRVSKNLTLADGTDINGQKITLDLISKVIGFDVKGLDLRMYMAANNAQRKANMIAETASCTNVPAPQPTASTPISCEEHLLVPPADFKTDFPSYTKNVTCPAHIANQAETDRTELDVCGEYWVSAWCNATDEAHRQNATYACRGFSQIGNETNPDGTAKINNDRNLLYYTNRLHAVTSEAIIGKNAQGKEVIIGYKEGGALKANIDKYGDILGRKKTWNSFFTEVKQKSIAYPWEHDNANKSREEVRDNALQAAATAIFGKSWGAVKEQERLNNCSTTWDGPVNPGPSTNPSTSPTGPVVGDGTAVNVTVVLHGIGAGGDNANASSANSNQDPKRKTRDAKIILTNAADDDATRQEFSATLTWDAASKKYKASVPVQVGSGLYTVKIKVDSYLVRRIGRSAVQITQGQATNLPEAQLITGNANNDTVLSVLDYNMLRDCVSVLQPARACNDAAKKLATDFNDDDKVDNVDYTLFVRELSVQNGD